MDLMHTPTVRGFFSPHEVMAEITRLNACFREPMAAPAREVVVVLDEASNAFLTNSLALRAPMISQALSQEYNRVGCPVAVHLLDELLEADFPEFKVYVFLGCLTITEPKRRAILRLLARQHAVAVWVYAAGQLQPGWQIEGMEELIGVPVS